MSGVYHCFKCKHHVRVAGLPLGNCDLGGCGYTTDESPDLYTMMKRREREVEQGIGKPKPPPEKVYSAAVVKKTNGD